MLFLAKAPIACGDSYRARRSLLVAFGRGRAPAPCLCLAMLPLCSPPSGPGDHDHEASRRLCSHLCPLSYLGWQLLPHPPLITVLSLGLCPLSLSLMPWVFNDTANAIVGPLPSPGKGRCLDTILSLRCSQTTWCEVLIPSKAILQDGRHIRWHMRDQHCYGFAAW